MRNSNRLKYGTIKSVPMDEIIPYWRNPRRVTDEAVNAVAQSLRYYGYQQPIVVDTKNVIIVGHTRYAALRRMEVEQISVLVADHLTPEQVKQLRLVDNRSGEYTSWDFDKLMNELESLDSDAGAQFFPEMTMQEIDQFAAQEAATQLEWDKVDTEVDFVCPACFHSWEVTVTRENVMSGRIEQKDDK